MKRGETLPTRTNRAVFAPAPIALQSSRLARSPREERRRIPQLEIVHATPGRLRIRVTKLDSKNESLICPALMAVNGVRSATLNPVTGSVVVRF